MKWIIPILLAISMGCQFSESSESVDGSLLSDAILWSDGAETMDAWTQDDVFDGDGDGDVDEEVDDSTARGVPLRVMTWNLETFPLTEETIDRTAAILEAHAPDIVALQEIQDPEDFERLVDEAPGYGGTLNYDPGAWAHVGLLWREESVDVSDEWTIFTGDWYAFPRPPLTATVRLLGDDEEELFDFVIVVLHLKAMRDRESFDRRRTACERLDEWISEESVERGELDFVVLGDWNDELDDPPEWNVFGPLIDKSDEYLFLTSELEERGEFSYIPYESFLDHIMVTFDALQEYGEGQTVVLPLELHDPGYEEYVSDHRPVMSTFRVAQ